MPVRCKEGMNGVIPNFWNMQSHDRLDWGGNVNTLNCLSINFPMYMAVSRDPDSLSVYSAIGQVYGVYFVSSLNMQTGFVYALNYPSSGSNCQIFSMGKRRGTYGYDAISVKQE